MKIGDKIIVMHDFNDDDRLTQHKIYEIVKVRYDIDDLVEWIYIFDDNGRCDGWRDFIFNKVVEIK